MVNKFIEETANKNSKSKRALVCGFGVNDADYKVHSKGKHCPYYSVWHSMLTRCYNKLRLKINPTYTGCSVCKEWLTFSVFKKWMLAQDWERKELDKDLLEKGNKVYSPTKCIFVTKEINQLTTNIKRNSTTGLPGVYLDKRDGKFEARITEKGRVKFLGRFASALDASKKYEDTRQAMLTTLAANQTNLKLKRGLLSHV